MYSRASSRTPHRNSFRFARLSLSFSRSLRRGTPRSRSLARLRHTAIDLRASLLHFAITTILALSRCYRMRIMPRCAFDRRPVVFRNAAKERNYASCICLYLSRASVCILEDYRKKYLLFTKKATFSFKRYSCADLYDF